MRKFTFDNMPQLRILDNNQIEIIHEKAIHVLENLGMVIAEPEALKHLDDAGCIVDYDEQKVRFPRKLIESAIESAPHSFDLYDREGNYYCKFGDGSTRFNPGSSAGNVLTKDGATVRPSRVSDLKLLTKVAQSLDPIDFVSSSVVCEEAPGELGSQYLYFTEMQHSTKPIIGGATDAEGVNRTIKLLTAVMGDDVDIATKPYMVFDICATSPLKWSHIGARNIIDCAKNNIPIEFISAQIAGATGPVTLAGGILQHTVEILAGIALSQVVKPGVPVVYGGAPCIFNMKTMYTPMEAMESNMITAAYALMGKYYALPVHTYAAMSDAKVIDYQAGSETARSGLIAMLAGVDNVSGPGGLNVIAEMSAEKLVMDADYIGTLKRFRKGIRFDDDALAAELMLKVGSGGNYLTEKHTLTNYKTEQCYDNIVMNYQERAAWKKSGEKSIFDNARDYVESISQKDGCVLDKEKTGRLEKAFIEICLEAGLTREKGEELIETYRNA